MIVQFTVYAKPEPQGSTRAFMVKGKPKITSTNKDLKSFRQQVSLVAIGAMNEQRQPLLARNFRIRLVLAFFFARPKSKSKKAHMVVKPDLDKLIRSIGDALSGICYVDDSQIAQVAASKDYGQPEQVIIRVESIAHDLI